jgi:CRP-like cAMP-binding protein
MAMKLTDVYLKADNRFLEQKYEEALTGYLAVAKADPAHLWVRFKIGSTLEQLRRPNRAFGTFKALAWHCIKAGYPLLGLVATKRAMRLQAALEGPLDALADLYCLESDRIQEQLPLFELPKLDGSITLDKPSSPAENLTAAAAELSQQFPHAKYPKELPAIPLFSYLTAEAFFPILEIIQSQSYAPGETIIKQGDPCSSIFMLAHGEIEISQSIQGEKHTLARLIDGAVFGEMALITDAPRVATVVALRESEVLELRNDDLELAAEELDDIVWALAKFTRQRFLSNLLLTSPIFTPFPEKDKQEILTMFTSTGVPTDEVIIKEGMVAPGLYIILGGEVEVTKFEGDTRVHLARLKEGSIFGEISLINDSPTTATVQAIRGGEFLLLPREDFQDLLQRRPEIRAALANLSEERIKEQQQAIRNAETTAADGSVIF